MTRRTGRTVVIGMGLGINKDLEPLVRRVRRAGGTVEVTRSTHVRWTLPDGQVLHSGLTMSGASAKDAQRRVEAALAALEPASEPAPRRFVVGPAPRGKYQVVDTRTGEPVTNANGYPRTFGQERDAARQARRLNAGSD